MSIAINSDHIIDISVTIGEGKVQITSLNIPEQHKGIKISQTSLNSTWHIMEEPLTKPS